MPRRRRHVRNLTKRLENVAISDSDEDQDEKTFGWVDDLIRNRDVLEVDHIQQFLDLLRKRKISCDNLVRIIVKAKCALEFVLIMEMADVTAKVLDQTRAIPHNESHLLVDLAIKSMYAENTKSLLMHGPDASFRRSIFIFKMVALINDPNTNLASLKHYVKQLMAANFIDDVSVRILENTLQKGRSQAIRMLLDCNVDEHLTAKYRENILAHLFANSKVDVRELLQGKVVDVNGLCRDMTPLHFATHYHAVNNVRYLLESGADPNVRGLFKYTPLFSLGNQKCVELLLEYGADVQLLDNQGRTAMDQLGDFRPTSIMLAKLALYEAQSLPIFEQTLDRITADMVLSSYFTLLRDHVKLMKRFMIFDGCSALDIIISEPKDIAHYFNNENILHNKVKESRQLPLLWYYLTLAQRNMTKAFIMNNNLRCAAFEQLLQIFEHVNFNMNLVQMIEDYLTYEDLLSFETN
ncbi:uncharacterized protein LOC131674887 [Phymastichus coffea]|uniref:uncharacterized protein LOC131666344 n=1 Tax=Phymastichus coffea TaxID=108790 RepID=UPI00273B5660|nr:uncharacterized protein LOC131666344 [Phymastichus coffea]XP_058809680.1 uncharacterized protein LOC131674887 [Phymastichus coffea]